MKKIFYSLMALAALCCVSCSDETVETLSDEAIKLDITVNDPDTFVGSDTRAVDKTGWAEGDKILVTFDGNLDPKNMILLAYNPETLKFECTVPETFKMSLNATGRFIAVHHPGISLEGITGDGENFKTNYMANGQSCNLVLVDERRTYTYDSSTKTLSMTINMHPYNYHYNSSTKTDKEYYGAVQVVVPGIDTSHSDYTMNITAPGAGIIVISNFVIDSNSWFSILGGGAYAIGFPNTDGAVFYLYVRDPGELINKDYTFTLTHGSNKYTYIATNKLLKYKSAIMLPEFSVDADGNPTSGCKWAKVVE